MCLSPARSSSNNSLLKISLLYVENLIYIFPLLSLLLLLLLLLLFLLLLLMLLLLLLLLLLLWQSYR